MVKTARLFGSILLVVSLFLPMSQCTMTADSTGKSIWLKSHSSGDHTEVQTIHLVPLGKDVDWKNGFWVKPSPFAPYFYILAFFWPLIVVVLSEVARLRSWRAVFFWLELIPLCYAGYVLYVIGWCVGQPLVGAYVGATGVTLCVVIWLMEVLRIASARFRPPSDHQHAIQR
jgi:hypothetical protein